MAKKHNDDLFCIVDKKAIDPARAKLGKGASTCSAECRRKLTAIRRRMADATKCRTCGVPSTIAERREFNKWRAAQPGYVKPVGRGRPVSPPCGCGHNKIDHVRWKRGGHCKGDAGKCVCTEYHARDHAKAATA
jgi:hypothetical protein